VCGGIIYRRTIAAAVLLRVPMRAVEYREIHRDYPEGKIQRAIQDFTVRETLEEDEDVTAAALRGLREELQQVWKGVALITPDLLVHTGTTESTAASQAYQGLQTQRVTHTYLLDLDATPWPEPVIELVDHCGTTITIKRHQEKAAPPIAPSLNGIDEQLRPEPMLEEVDHA
jgi:hypothetical protein